MMKFRKIVYVGQETHVCIPQPPPLGEVIVQRGVPAEIEVSVASNLLSRPDWRLPKKEKPAA